MGFDAAVSIPMDTFGCGLVALQRFDLLNASLIAGNVAQAVAWIAVLLAGGGLLPLAAVTVGISLVGQVTRYVILRRLMPGLTVSTRLVDREVVRLLARPAGWFALGSSVDGLRDYVSVLVLGVVRNVATAGLYAVGEKLALLASKFGTAVADPYFPHAASLVGSGEGHRLKHAAPSGSRVAAGVIIPLCLVVALFSRPALNAWAGHFYERAAPAVIVLAVAASMASFDVVPFKLVSGAGGQRLLSLMGLAEAGVAVVLTAVLGSFFGLVGVAVAGLVTVVGVEIGVTLPIVCRRLDVRVRDLVLPIARAHVLPVVVCGVVGGFVAAGPVMSYVQMHGRLANLAVVAVTAAAVLVLYAAVFVVTGLDREARRAVAARVSLAGHRARP